MAVLAGSHVGEMRHHLESIDADLRHDDLRAPESGLLMVRGRIGGDGAPFNIGEVTVSRAAIRLASGEVGFGYVLGRDREKARLIALCDALIQTESHRDMVENAVLAPIRRRQCAERELKARQVAATKVEFFTLVRGED
jgi:alpha-D-ribose 1-methylphosphonate 5-triphosphate synthase subunit PhnG